IRPRPGALGCAFTSCPAKEPRNGAATHAPPSPRRKSRLLSSRGTFSDRTPPRKQGVERQALAQFSLTAPLSQERRTGPQSTPLGRGSVVGMVRGDSSKSL